MPDVRRKCERRAVMDLEVTSGPGGFPMQKGARYRVLATIPDAAFRVLPWTAPSTADITMSLVTAGLTDIVAVMPWESAPSDWPFDAADARPQGEDVFAIRVEATWNGGATLAPSIRLPGGAYAISFVRVWLRAAPAQTPQPESPPPSKPTPKPPSGFSPHPQPAPVNPKTPPAASPRATPGRGMSAGAKVALGGGAIAAATLLIAHTPFRRSRTA